jgi:hypothetical protein
MQLRSICIRHDYVLGLTIDAVVLPEHCRRRPWSASMHKQRTLECPVRFEQRLPVALAEALDAAAQRRMTSRAEYFRGALLDRLRADGLDPAQFAQAS